MCKLKELIGSHFPIKYPCAQCSGKWLIISWAALAQQGERKSLSHLAVSFLTISGCVSSLVSSSLFTAGALVAAFWRIVSPLSSLLVLCTSCNAPGKTQRVIAGVQLQSNKVHITLIRALCTKTKYVIQPFVSVLLINTLQLLYSETSKYASNKNALRNFIVTVRLYLLRPAVSGG